MVTVDELRQFDLFQALPLTTLQSLAKWSEKVVFGQGATIVRQGEPGDYFFVILSGSVGVYRELESGQHRLLNKLTSGEFFGEEALLTKSSRNATVRSLTRSQLIRFDSKVFDSLRRGYPEWVEILYNTARLRTQFIRYFPEREPDEVGVVFALRHRYALIESLLPPVIVTVLIIVAFAFVASSGSVPMRYLWVILTLLTVGLFVWFLWLYLDWANDYLIVTTKRVVHIEQVVLYSLRRSTAFVEQVHSVTTETPTIGARLLGYKDLIIQTGSPVGTIRFSSVGDAEKISDKILKTRDLAHAQRDVEERQEIDKQLRSHIGYEEDGDSSSLPSVPQPMPATLPGETQPGSIYHLLSYFVPKTVLRIGNTVTWRRHWYILFRTTFLPALVFLALNVAILWLFLDELLITGFRQPFLWLSLIVIYLAALGWLIWRYEDWYNDYYQMIGSQIIDRYSLPFGFKERREVVIFNYVQNVRADIPKWTYKLLNMGHVYIDTVGDAKPIKFDSVFDPITIQQEIFNRLDTYRESQRRESRQQRSKELADWFAAYHDIERNRPGA